MDFIEHLEQNNHKNKVQKMNHYEILNQVLILSKEDKLRLLDVLISDLGIKDIKQAANQVGISYNGWKNNRETKEIAGKLFAVTL